MSSLVRRIQRDIMKKKGVENVPVRRRSNDTMVGTRPRLCAAHIAYYVDGAAILAPAPKPKRVRKSRAKPQVAA